MSKFVIFEDQENFQENPIAGFADAKKDRQKLAPLKNKAIYDENAIEKQVRKKTALLRPFVYFHMLFLNFTAPEEFKTFHIGNKQHK